MEKKQSEALATLESTDKTDLERQTTMNYRELLKDKKTCCDQGRLFFPESTKKQADLIFASWRCLSVRSVIFTIREKTWYL